MLPQGATVELSFTLPQSLVPVRLVGTVMWAHASGRAGIKFGCIDSGEHVKLRDWFDSVLPSIGESPAETGVACDGPRGGPHFGPVLAKPRDKNF